MSAGAFLARLAALLDGAGIRYMVAGSFASAFHGVARATQDLEDSIIAKLEWAKQSHSERQLRDVAGIVATRGPSLDRAYVERWVRELGLEAEWARSHDGAGDPLV